jgi:ribonuclease HI
MTSSKLPYVRIYTDGSCIASTGVGGWGCVLVHPKSGWERELYGPHPKTTNNRMEMTGAIKGLEALTRPCEVLVVTDSQYLQKGITLWVPGWIRSNWINSQGKPVKNRDLWERLIELTTEHDVKWKWVKGHAGHEYNERADKLAAKGRAKVTWK